MAIPALKVDELRTDTRGDRLDAFAYDMNRIYPGSAGDVGTLTGDDHLGRLTTLHLLGRRPF